MNAKTIKIFDVSFLPEHLRNNWHIYLLLRNDAIVNYAKACADAANTSNDKEWCDVFDMAQEEWSEANPFDPIWSSDWPEGAENYLGHEVDEEARRLMAGAQ